MNRIYTCTAIFFVFVLTLEVNGQNFSCYDSLQVAPGAYCPPNYEPVCACNGITYRNSCFANIEGYQQFQNGICEAIDININQNPVFNNLVVDIILKFKGDAQLYIFDFYGKTYFYKTYRDIERDALYLNTENFPRGVYFIIAQTYNDRVIRKFLKIEL